MDRYLILYQNGVDFPLVFGGFYSNYDEALKALECIQVDEKLKDTVSLSRAGGYLVFGSNNHREKFQIICANEKLFNFTITKKGGDKQ